MTNIINDFDTLGKPYSIFGMENIDAPTISQFFDCMKHSAIIRGALMPDAHLGYTLPIGGVVAAEEMIFPAFVGYDIGCGMYATQLLIDPLKLYNNGEDIQAEIRNLIPLGFNHRSEPLIEINLDTVTNEMAKIYHHKNGDCQLGTLGGGNHFIEIGKDENNIAWIIIHSGSRGVGHGCAEYYMKKAADSDRAKEGCYGFRYGNNLFVDYLQDMNFCTDFALFNRKLMVDQVIKAIEVVMGCTVRTEETSVINRNHNHAIYRNGLWIHRKGATHAEKDMMGVIPGNSADGSFIVRGLGCEAGLWSSSHGAGRFLSRRKAKQTLSIKDYESRMRGVIADVLESNLDESPQAYKDIHKVMEYQQDLVKIEAHVTPLISIKG